MAWITTISYEDSLGKLRRIYDRIRSADGLIDNILLAHSLRPHTLEGHMYLYKNVLHHQENTLPSWFLEMIGIYVSQINHCDYCIKHHKEGLKRLVSSESFQRIIEALKSGIYEHFEPKEVAALNYAYVLTKTPEKLSRKVYNQLIETGFNEGEILEINQVVAYFNYANRTVLGLGITTEGDVLGRSPSGSGQDQWDHR